MAKKDSRRKCLACRISDLKPALIRFVFSPVDGLVLDKEGSHSGSGKEQEKGQGKILGRGAYLHPDCIQESSLNRLSEPRMWRSALKIDGELSAEAIRLTLTGLVPAGRLSEATARPGRKGVRIKR